MNNAAALIHKTFFEYFQSANYTVLAVTLFVILLAALFVNRAWIRVRRKLLPYVVESSSIWNEVLLEAAYYPAMLAIWLMALVLGESAVERNFGFDTVHLLQKFFSVCAILILSWFLAGLVTEFERLSLEKAEKTSLKLDAQTLDVVTKVAHFLIFLSMTLMILQTLGVQITGLLAVGGFGGLLVGVASKDLLGNLLGGFVVYLDSPFKVGETINSPDDKLAGTVERIHWRMTVLRTPEKQTLYVPNSRFGSIAIQNVTRMTNRQIKEVIGLRYEDMDKVGPIMAEIESMLQQHPGIDSKMNIMAKFSAYGASSLDCTILAFTKTVDMLPFFAVRQEVYLKIAEIVKQHGADFAYPTSTIYVPSPVVVEHPTVVTTGVD